MIRTAAGSGGLKTRAPHGRTRRERSQIGNRGAKSDVFLKTSIVLLPGSWYNKDKKLPLKFHNDKEAPL